MTVQQAPAAQPTAPAEQVVTLPAQRTAAHDDAAPAPEPTASGLRGWGSPEDRVMARWIVLMMVFFGLYSGTFVFLGTRVWG